MGKASRGKRERKPDWTAQIAYQANHAISQSPWYESNLLWVPLTTAFAIILTVAAAMIKGDFRFLLWLALALLVHPLWILARNIGITRSSHQRITFLIFLFLSIVATYMGYEYLAEEPIAVSPSEVKLAHLFHSGDSLRGVIDLSIHNKGDDPYHEIWVKVLVNSDLLSAETIDLDFPTIEERIGSGKDPTGIALSSGCFRGRDGNSHPAFLCIIDRLEPKEFFKIQLTTSKARPSDMSEDQIGTAVMRIVTFSKDPGRRFRNVPGQASGAGSEHKIPEKFTSTTMIHFCPDIGEPFKSKSPITCTPNSKYKIERR